ncbi:MAG TPA: sigma-70 family RNA polymerase sigma factor [Saprospiraceae bacterium]|nr:sigma-70 family RNA polymerase sigma factor [Saprospiraceae bacterium]HND88244.1 sigma-70 family RNA polymerase sigma factor [Saprospiraceae bacterium]
MSRSAVKTPSAAFAKYTDSDLISRYLREQNSAYFTELYRRYAGKVFAKCISMLSDEGLARDATQEIFIKVLLNLSKFTEQSSFSTWIYSITYNYCIDIIRKKKKMPLQFTEDVSRVSSEAVVDIPDSVLLEMKQERLEKVLDLLPEGDRAILMMKYIDDMSIKDIGDLLGKTESAIKMQIMRAKMRAQSLHDTHFGHDPIERYMVRPAQSVGQWMGGAFRRMFSRAGGSHTWSAGSSF